MTEGFMPVVFDTAQTSTEVPAATPNENVLRSVMANFK
jgi:hypothetical protein